jgi:hypothetical protein
MPEEDNEAQPLDSNTAPNKMRQRPTDARGKDQDEDFTSDSIVLFTRQQRHRRRRTPAQLNLVEDDATRMPGAEPRSPPRLDDKIRQSGQHCAYGQV